MDCFRWAKKEVGTAPFPKAKEYQKLRVGAYDQEADSESEIYLYTTNDGSSEEEDEQESDQVEFSAKESEQKEEVSTEQNWWDDYSADSE